MLKFKKSLAFLSLALTALVAAEALALSSLSDESKPQITKENTYVQCFYREKSNKTAFQFLIEDGKVLYLQPFTGKRATENRTYLLQAKTQINGLDSTGYNYGFHPRRGAKGVQKLKIFGSKMLASSIWIPGSFLKNPKATSSQRALVVALLAQDKSGNSVKGQGQTEAFSCVTNELQ